MSDSSKFRIEYADLDEDLQQDALTIAASQFKLGHTDKEIAANIKRKFDTEHNPTWHCVVGTNFGSNIFYEATHCIYFYFGKTGVLLWKAG